jgi:hypothetical protein
VHGEHRGGVCEVSLHCVGRLFRAHGEIATDWKQQVGWRVELVDDLHVTEDTSVTRVVDRHIAKSEYPASWRTTVNEMAFVEATAGTVVSRGHREFAEAHVCGSTLVHLLDLVCGDTLMGFQVLSNLVDANNLCVGLLGSFKERLCASSVIKVAVGNQNQVCIVRHLRLPFSILHRVWELGIVKPWVEVDHIGLASVIELDSKSGVAKPLDLWHTG